jgi:hypothetical protein
MAGSFIGDGNSEKTTDLPQDFASKRTFNLVAFVCIIMIMTL